MNQKEHGLLYTVIFTFIVCFVFVFVLSLTNIATLPIVQANEVREQQYALLSAMGLSGITEETSVEELAQYYQQVDTFEHNGTTYYTAEIGGVVTVAKQFQGAGLWGTIEGVLAIQPEQQRISGLRLLTHNETPGLGARIEQEWYLEQFNNELFDGGNLSMDTREGKGDPNRDNSKIDGVSGATRTSEAMIRIVNAEINDILAAIGG